MKLLTRSVALVALLLPALLLAQPGYFQRSTLPEHTGNGVGFKLPTETADGSILSVLDTDTTLYLVKFDTNGDAQWARTYPAGTNDPEWRIIRISATSDGGAIMIQDAWIWDDQPWQTYFHVVLTRIDPQGDILWSKHYSMNTGGFSIGPVDARLNTEPGDLHTVLLHMTTTQNTTVLRVNDSGDLLWSRKLAMAPSQAVIQLVQDPSLGACVLMRSTYIEGSPIAVMRLDNNGNYLWGRTVMMIDEPWTYLGATGLATTDGTAASQDVLYIYGRQKALLPTDKDFLLKFNNSGVLEWYKWYSDHLYNARSEGFSRELPSGDLEFGITQRQRFDVSGTHLGGGERFFPVGPFGSGYGRSWESGRTMLPGFIQSGSYQKTDQDSLLWTTPAMERVPWDLTNTCVWTADTTFALTDSFIPMALVDVDTLPAPLAQIVSVTDTNTIAVPANLTAYFDFCTIVGVDENIAYDQPILEVFPSLIAAGDRLNLRASAAAEVTVLDTRGRIVWRERVPAGLTNVPTSGLASGLHLVQRIDGQGIALGSARFVVE